MNQNRAEFMSYTEIGTMSFMENVKELLRNIGYHFAGLLVNRPKYALYGGTAIIILAIICTFTIQPNPSLSAHAEHENTKYFTTVQIESGDTLWDIAQDYISPEYASIQDYIDEVESINHISEDDITAGCYITIPYYSEEPME